MKHILTILALCCAMSAAAQTQIDAKDASRHIGERVVACAKVVGTRYLSRSGVTFLNLVEAYPASPLTVVIFDKDRAHFPTPPEKLYADKDICVTGQVTSYQGRAEIIITQPADISVR